MSHEQCSCQNREVYCKCGCRSDSAQEVMCCHSCPCFPGDVSVRLDTGKNVQMKNLVTGQKILSVQNGKRTFSEVKTFLHREPASNTTFVTLITEQGHRITLSELHIVFASANKSANVEPRFARSVKPGDYLHSMEDDLRPERVVQKFFSVKQGFYAPLTDTGTLVVNGILASCFAHFLQQDLAQFCLFPLRWFPWLLEPWQEDGLSPLMSHAKDILLYYFPE